MDEICWNLLILHFVNEKHLVDKIKPWVYDSSKYQDTDSKVQYIEKERSSRQGG